MGVKEEFLRKRMDEAGISQADLSRKTDIPPGTISGLLRNEEGIEKTSYSNVRKICEVLGLNMDDLERVGPDGKLPESEPDVPEEAVAGETVPVDVPPAGQDGEDEEYTVATDPVPQECPQETVGEETGCVETDAVGQAEEESPVPGFDPSGFIRYDPEEEGLLEVRHYYVVSRLAACSEEDLGRMVSVIPSVRSIEENGMYAVRLPGSRMTVLRKVWRMDDGMLLLRADRFDDVPCIIRSDAEGFSVIGKVVVEEDDSSCGLC